MLKMMQTKPQTHTDYRSLSETLGAKISNESRKCINNTSLIIFIMYDK